MHGVTVRRARRAWNGGAADDRTRATHGGHPHDPRLSRCGPRCRLWDDEGVSIWSDSSDEEGRAPICPYCGVTTLPAELAHVLDTDFVCDNADCEAYGERIER